MEKLETTNNLAEQRIGIWIRMHERLLAEKKNLEDLRVQMTCNDENTVLG